jgi:hypothetical protein
MTSGRLTGPTLVPWSAGSGARLERVPQGDYGVVRLTAGRFKGFLGLYDDDDRVAIVYPWGPPRCAQVTCLHSSMALRDRCRGGTVVVSERQHLRRAPCGSGTRPPALG